MVQGGSGVQRSAHTHVAFLPACKRPLLPGVAADPHTPSIAMKRALNPRKNRGQSGGQSGGPAAAGASSAPSPGGGDAAASSATSARYQYAMRQYAGAVPPSSGGDGYENPMNDGHVRRGYAHPAAAEGGGGPQQEELPLPMAEASGRRRTEAVEEGHFAGEGRRGTRDSYPGGGIEASAYTPPTATATATATGRASSPPISPTPSSYSYDTNDSGYGDHIYASGGGSQYPAMPVVPDDVYEEHYGNAYVGKNLKYIYPSGYQDMRPRSRPWKLSIGVCTLFTWLTVFIVGHCSDQAAEMAYVDDAYMDDDAYIMEVKWCGSRPLYFMWVVSVLITGMSCAYCAVIGYIQVRDFSIANGRSQPPGLGEGRSDYHVNLGDASRAGGGGGGEPSSYASYQDGYGGGNEAIYQSDGTSRFWGNHIYKPTQAAVAVTSR